MSADLGRLLKRTYAAVLFDMDGTLIDSAPSVLRSWTIWSGEFGIDLEQLKTFHGVPASGVIAHFLAPEVHERADARLRELEIADAVGIPILPGGAEALAALAGSGRVAIATSCTADLAEARVAASGLAAPPVLVTASECTRGKPDPEPYLRAAERLGVDPRECLVVEDATAGLAAARAAGCATLALTTTTRADVIAAAGDADAIVPDLSAVRFVVTSEGVRIEGSG
ncbi:MAG: HAD-IA family hydrolase [Tetrasphaera sp.]